MLATARLPVWVVVGVLLLVGCSNGQTDGNTAPESSSPPSPSAVTSSAAPSLTTSAEPSAEDSVSIALNESVFTVDASGDLTVVETLTLDVPVDDRHGIYRTFDSATKVKGFSATLDGSPTPVKATRENGGQSFRIGDPDRTLTVGEHVARLQYRVADVLSGGPKGDRVFDWYLVAPEWTMDVHRAELTVHLPRDAQKTNCVIGGTSACELSGLGTRTLRIITGSLPSHTAVRLQVLLRKSG